MILYEGKVYLKTFRLITEVLGEYSEIEWDKQLNGLAMNLKELRVVEFGGHFAVCDFCFLSLD